MVEQSNSGKQKIIFVTNDRWLHEKGVLDPMDQQIIKDAATAGEVVVMNMEQALEEMKKEEPEKFGEFRKEIAKMIGELLKVLTMEEIVEFSRRADEHKQYYDAYFARYMVVEQAKQIRESRVNQHYTWRSVARAAYAKLTHGDMVWMWLRQWEPPSNQLAGMSLCQRAAEILGQDYRKEPWN